MNKLNILNTVAHLGKYSFGLGQISVNLAKSQRELNHNAKIWCLDNHENIMWASESHDFPAEHITKFDLVGPRNLWYSPSLNSYVDSLPHNTFDVAHQHGIWTGISRATLLFRHKHKIPTVVAPHGSLNAWALNLSRWKKKIALSIYERDNLDKASCLHATSESEIFDFRNFGLKNPIAYINNGIQEKHLDLLGNEKRFREQYGITANKRILFFLSRISPKKGLLMLVEAINTIREDFNDWQLIIAGTDEFDHKKDVESLVKQHNLEDIIKVIGPLYGEAKADGFAAAELFILPSYSEGSPMVILDSLASSVPVITTKASSWSDLATYNCGWLTDINIQSISLALREAVCMSAEDLSQMGKRGSMLIASKYTWPQLALKTIMLYEWLLGQTSKPDFVVLK